MDYFIVSILTIATFFAILKIIGKKEKQAVGRIIHRQSDMHMFMKYFFSNISFEKKQKTQMIKREQENTVKIVAIDDKAYWVVDNVFYVTSIVDDRPDIENAMPVDTSNMSKEDIDKMLFILDNLDRGDKDERGSSGN
jgi:hypothetical protein